MGHMEPGAGLAGAMNLVAQLQDKTASPNAQLRALNSHVGGALRADTCALAVQLGAMMTEAQGGGVSSFGYAGTIAHAVLACESGERQGATCDSDFDGCKDERRSKTGVTIDFGGVAPGQVIGGFGWSWAPSADATLYVDDIVYVDFYSRLLQRRNLSSEQY